jgi:hypothetical protein
MSERSISAASAKVVATRNTRSITPSLSHDVAPATTHPAWHTLPPYSQLPSSECGASLVSASNGPPSGALVQAPTSTVA